MLMTLRYRTRAITGALLLLVAGLIGVSTLYGITKGVDSALYTDIVSIRTGWLTDFFKVPTFLFNPAPAFWTTLVGAVIGAILSKRWIGGIYVMIAASAAATITGILKRTFDRSRPPVEAMLVDQGAFSYPSGHATAAAGLFLSMALAATARHLTRSQEYLVWGLAAGGVLLVALSRMYLGVHWFADVIGGTLIGFGTALLLSIIMQIPKRDIKRFFARFGK